MYYTVNFNFCFDNCDYMGHKCVIDLLLMVSYIVSKYKKNTFFGIFYYIFIKNPKTVLIMV